MNRGYEFQGLDIKNIDSKLLSIDLDIDLISRKEEIYLYLINYLGVVTKEQLCLIGNVLESSIRTSLSRISKLYGDIINVSRDEDYNAYYTTNRKAIFVLKKFSDVESNMNFYNKKHLSKINDFFIILFVGHCKKIKIKHECNINYLDKVLRADAIINAEHNGVNYEFILEQDNNTIKKSKLLEKVSSYYNMLLHSPLDQGNKVRYYIFRLDIFMTKAQIKKSEKNLNKDWQYLELSRIIEELEDLYDSAKDAAVASIYGHKVMTLGINFSERKTILLQNISSMKTTYKLEVEKLKRKYKNYISSNYINDRIDSVKNALLNEVEVQYFDYDSINTIFNDITGQKGFSCINSKIDGRSILLRTNFLCGDRRIDNILNKFLFGEVNILIKLIKRIYCEDDLELNEDMSVQQTYIKIGYESLLFSNVVRYNIKNSNIDFVLLMPTVNVSDYARIEYLNSLDSDVLNNSINNQMVFIIAVTDLDSRELYENMIFNYNSKKSKMFVEHVNLEGNI